MRILVVGDAMVDTYWSGSIRRLNPEKHSAPLVSVVAKRQFPGGAGNVAENLTALGVVADVVSGAGLIEKHRVIDESGVVCRFDEGDELQPIEELSTDEYDAVIVSDYGKGSVGRRVIDRVQAAACPVFVDTKADPIPWMTTRSGSPAGGVECFFPNQEELRKYRANYAYAPMVLETSGPHGAKLRQSGNQPVAIPCSATRVVNVCGAGDTVVAAFVFARMKLGYGGKLAVTAASFAMDMAAVAVANPYTCAPTLEQAIKAFPEKEQFFLSLAERSNAAC